ncbi:MAG: quinone-dependent dihydroorotate dehydrogenase [Actinophytocola sp.]|uniref:quinone-dependent dihydroorotate dehydrogenase n=1 Tax=Actinophytocola sp. TaxID=1872138 RepID=UPI003D6BBE0B
MVYQHVLRRALFRFDPEVAHERTVALVSRLGRVRPATRPSRRFYGASTPRTVFGVRFPGLVGLAAGMDKDGVAVRGWPALGFGFVELGTVTWHPQPGNPRPRLYRLPASEAVINRMGFNNRGAAALAERLRLLGPAPVPVGISVGKSKVATDAEADYVSSVRVLWPYADYFAVNVSSPNTPGLRGLQDRAALDALLAAVVPEAHGRPVLVKIAPDLSLPAIEDVLSVCHERGVAGVIATNTTLSRAGLSSVDSAATEVGGLSGRPLFGRALEVVSFVAARSELPVVGVGGVASADDAARMFDAGAALVQLYTGFVYHGPGLVRRINRLPARDRTG